MTAAQVPDQTSLAPSASERDQLQSREPGGQVRNQIDDGGKHWDNLLTMVADLAFETDEWGRFNFVVADPSLGWPASTLLGRSAALLLAEDPDGSQFNPFRVTAPARRRRVRVRRGDGGFVCLTFTVLPLLDATGRIVGARGLAVGPTDDAKQDADGRRQGEVLNDMLHRVSQEVLVPRKIGAVLNTLTDALHAEGSSLIILPASKRAPQLEHQTGHGAEVVFPMAASMLETQTDGSALTPDAHRVLVTACQTRFGERAGLAVWRQPGSPPWSPADATLLASGANIVRMLLEHELVQREMARTARTDPLTGLLTRRAFLDELERRTDRLDREELPGTLMLADLDHFKSINDQLGHEMGDHVLIHTSAMLRRIVRPSDLVARLGGDQFAVWLDGADHMTAAERAEYLCETVPQELAETAGPDAPRISISIGIAPRMPHAPQPLDYLMRRADSAKADVKSHGRGHWRVSHSPESP